MVQAGPLWGRPTQIGQELKFLLINVQLYLRFERLQKPTEHQSIEPHPSAWKGVREVYGEVAQRAAFNQLSREERLPIPLSAASSADQVQLTFATGGPWSA